LPAGLLLPHDHLEERGLAGAIGPDDADDAAVRQVEGKVLHEEPVPVRLADALRAHDDVAQARAGRDEQLLRLAARLFALLRQERLVLLQPRLALGVPGAG
jgi:hypothetical protein